ncbi:MAG: phospholipid carrier-dependent glycosyltransferase [Patescibacteria group bacterium]
MKIKTGLIIILILLGLALLTRFFYFNFPPEVVFDEVHFGSFIRSYFTHENYFDIHPPLGKLIIAGFAKISRANLSEDGFKNIGHEYNKKDLFAMRFLPALMSVLFVLIIYFLTLKLTGAKTAAFVAAFMVLFDNALIVHSRFVLLDIFLLSFGFLAFYFLLAQEEKSFDKLRIRKWLFIILSGLFLGMCYSIKWTGLSAVLLCGLIMIYQLYKNKKCKEFFIKTAAVFGLSLLVYILIFAIHFQLLNKSGYGDNYLSPEFKNKNFIGKLIETNEKMYQYNAGISSEHPFASAWKQWPFGEKAIFYWMKSTDNPNKNLDIWLKGHTAIWWLSIFAVLISALIFFSKIILKNTKNFNFPVLIFLTAGWLVNFLPFVFINRPLFLYSYFTALVFSIILFAYLFTFFLNQFKLSPKNKKIIIAVLCALIVLAYLTNFNITYGL